MFYQFYKINEKICNDEKTVGRCDGATGREEESSHGQAPEQKFYK